MMPAISVILPVYNGLPYLQTSVGSVLEQAFRDFELIILDDCSTDGSYAYLKQLNDPRIQLYRNETNKGLFFNLNRMIEKSTAPLIKLWSQDDEMYPNCLAQIIDFHSSHSNLGFSYSGVDYIDENSRALNLIKPDSTPEIINRELHAKICFTTGSIAGNIANVTLVKTALQKTGLFDETMKISGDFDMWVRLAEYFPTGRIEQRLIKLRNHSGQLSSQKQFYIFHLKEDMVVFQKLLAYLPPNQQAAGRKIMRQKKLLFYYTLMLKALFKGRWQEAKQFFTALQQFEHMGLLTACYIYYKLLQARPDMQWPQTNSRY